MDVAQVEWVSFFAEFCAAGVSYLAGLLGGLWNQLVTLQAMYPQLLSMQTFFSVLGWGLAVWKWWEGREANLFRRFEEMIERNEAQLVKACSSLVDVMNRPGPGLLIQAPLFTVKPLRLVLERRQW